MSYQRTETGFTLVEVMVALFIVAIALPALMFQLGTQLDSTASLRDKTLATWVAEDRLALLRLEVASGQVLPSSELWGEISMAGRNWRWQLSTESTPVPGMSRVVVDIFDTNATAFVDALVSLSGYTLDEPAGTSP